MQGSPASGPLRRGATREPSVRAPAARSHQGAQRPGPCGAEPDPPVSPASGPLRRGATRVPSVRAPAARSRTHQIQSLTYRGQIQKTMTPTFDHRERHTTPHGVPRIAPPIV
ncbi:unnamed protein product [Lota lota]